MLPRLGHLRPWADPTQLQINRLPMHVPLSGFPRTLLDGAWSLEMFEHPDAVPAAAIGGVRRRSVTVAVPGNWTMQSLGGFVDLPHYTNVQMPFPGPPPRLPERNPAGVYRRSFNVAAAWLKRRTVLHVAGAESVHVVYLNDELVGYGTDSRLPSEYDVSGLVRRGANLLTIVVIRYSAHSYVEDQDQWWMAGLHRSVWLESRPLVHIGDLPIVTDFDPSTRAGVVECVTTVDFGGSPTPSWSVAATLRDPGGRPVGSPQIGEVPSHFFEPYVFTGHGVSGRWDVPDAQAWSAETPHLYTLAVELCDPSGVVRHRETQRLGVKRVEIAERQLLVNGAPVWIFGVNRHDHHPDLGSAVDIASMRADLVAMRAHNITAIRTSHYPNDTAFLDLCDELGFMVVAEANIESHAYNESLCDDPRYRTAWLERGARMVQRDRNHAAIIMWSLGNESGYGSNHDALAGWIRRADPTHPLHYEDAIRVEGWVDGGRAATDVVCPMYPEIAAIREYGASGVGDRPLIMCEYSHAMGNSNGSLADYWDVITTTPGLQGGFLWEWKDHALRQRQPDGSVRLAYGGQFGDMPNDGNFVADGLVSADLEPHPALAEVAWVHRPVVVTRMADRLRVENRQSFTDTAWLTGRWELLVDGRSTRRGRLRIPPIAPRSAVTVALPCVVPETTAEVHISVRWQARADHWWCRRGHLVAWDQLEWRAPLVPRLPARNGRVPEGLVSPPMLNLWRAATDNDGFKLQPELAERLGVGGQSLRRWQEQGVDRLPSETLVDHRSTVSHDRFGSVYRFVVDVPDSLSDLPRVGAVFSVSPDFDRARWLGRGPHENYPDRNRSAMVGEWEATIDELPYLVPQEFGLRTDCRWFELIDTSSGEVLRVDACGPATLHVSATRHRPADLFAAASASDLVTRDEIVVCVDVAHRGVGTASCGPDVLAQHQLSAGRHEFAFQLSQRSSRPPRHHG